MSELANTRESELVGAASAVAISTPVSVRVSPKSYFVVTIVGLFFSAFFLYASFDLFALGALVFSVVLMPVAALTDRIVFDGRELRRTGLIPRVWSVINRSAINLAVADIAQVETHALRALKRGGSVYYRYRTAVSGDQIKIVFASGGEDFRRMVRALFPVLAENVLDNRSIELRDYLGEPKEALMKAEFMHIPSTEVLEDAVDVFSRPASSSRRVVQTPVDPARVEYLRRLGNELRLAGYLLQALEVFRRALRVAADDPWLLFEASRCLHSYAGAERDERLNRRALAMLRLAERRAGGDDELLARIGECFFQFGDWKSARRVFVKTTDDGRENFRALRGMAEIALREGKLAHVIHNFASANRLAETPALRRWTETEAGYFSRLNSDEEYMDLEISRLNLIDKLANARQTAIRAATVGLPGIALGLLVPFELIANIGWAVSSVGVLIWSGLTVSVRVLGERVPHELMDEN